MTGKQLTVMWLGVALIAIQFYSGGQWKALFGLIKAPASTQKQNSVGVGTLSPTGKLPL